MGDNRKEPGARPYCGCSVIELYNRKRPHSALGGKPPAVVYWHKLETTQPDQQERSVA